MYFLIVLELFAGSESSVKPCSAPLCSASADILALTLGAGAIFDAPSGMASEEVLDDCCPHDTMNNCNKKTKKNRFISVILANDYLF